MSEDTTFVEFEGNKGVSRLNEIDLSNGKTIGGTNVYYNLRFERISDREVRMVVWTGEHPITPYETIKIEDVARKLANKRTPLIAGLIDIFGGEELPVNIERRLRVTARLIQQNWLSSPMNEKEVVDSDHIIDESELEEYREEVLEAAEKVLTADNPMAEIKKHLDNIIAGEDENKVLVFVLALSGKFKNPKVKTIICAIQESGAGKSWVLKNVAAFFHSHTVSHLTKNVLKYLGEELSGKEILFIKELGNMDQESDTSGNASIKMLSVDDGGLTTTYTVRNDEGLFTPITVNTEPITVLTSTTRTKLDEQFVRRYWVFSPDASIEQTRRIRKFKVRHENQVNSVLLGKREYTSMDFSLWTLKCVVEQLSEKEVIVPFTDSLYEIVDINKLRSRSDFDKIGTMLKMYGTLNYRNLPFCRNGEKVMYIMTPEKAIEALKIARQSLIYMARDTEARVYEFIKVLKDADFHAATLDKGATIINSKKQNELGTIMGGKSRGTILRYLEILNNMGFVDLVRGTKSDYELVEEPELMERKLSGYKDLDDINLTDELMNKMRNEANAYFESEGIGIRFESDGTFEAVEAEIDESKSS